MLLLSILCCTQLFAKGARKGDYLVFRGPVNLYDLSPYVDKIRITINVSNSKGMICGTKEVLIKKPNSGSGNFNLNNRIICTHNVDEVHYSVKMEIGYHGIFWSETAWSVPRYGTQNMPYIAKEGTKLTYELNGKL